MLQLSPNKYTSLKDNYQAMKRCSCFNCLRINTLLSKITAAQNEFELSHHRMRGLYFLTVVFAVTNIDKLIL